jgi:RNA 2',3'-cyclic 3'-phosphodiesterase
MRMFVAVVPPPEVVEQIGEFLEPRRDADPALRWTEPYQWHLTLAFLPEVGTRALDDLVERLTRAAARRQPFGVTIGGSGAFPTPERARVLWLGAAADPPESLTRLATGVRAAANKAGAQVTGGRFRPHLTLARVRQPQDATRWLRILGSYDGGRWPAISIDLIQSHLGQGRDGHPRYQTVASLLLGSRERT